MIPTLDELRKSLLPTPEAAPDYPSPGEQSLPATPMRSPAPSPSKASKLFRPHSTAQQNRNPFTDLLEDDDPFAEAHADRQRASAAAKDEEETARPPMDAEFLRAVAVMFGSSATYEEHLARLADASRSIRQLNRAADKALEPLKIFREKVQHLRDSYESARPVAPQPVFRKRFGRLLPLESTLETFDRTAATFGGHLFELSKSLDSAKALHARLVSLARTFETANTLHEQLSALAQMVEASRASEVGRKGKVRER